MKNVKTKPIRKMTIVKILIFQYVVFPLVTTAVLLVPTTLLWANGILDRSDTLLYCYIIFSLVLMAVIVPLIFRKAYGVPTNNSVACFVAIFAPPLVTVVATAVTYLVSSAYYASGAAMIANPLFVIINLFVFYAIENSNIWLMPLVTSVYAVMTYLLARKELADAYCKANEQVQSDNDEGSIKKTINKCGFKKVANVACAIVLAVVMVSSVGLAYPDWEYTALKNRFLQLNFSDEMDFYYEDKAPFYKNNGLPTLNEPPMLTFDDWTSAPSIDGATAFYPMYSAFAQYIYTDVDTVSDITQDRDYHVFVYERSGGDDYGGVLANKVICTKTGRAFERLTDGETDVIFTFEPSIEQVEKARQKGVEFELTKIGYDAFCFFVNTDNPVSNVTSQEIVDIYSGKLTNWRKLGYSNHRIMAFTRPQNSGSQTIMENAVMKGVEINSKYNATSVMSMGGIISVVGGYLNTPYAIGYTFMYYSMSMVTSDTIKYLAVDGVTPTSETVRSGQYIYSVPFYAITRKGQQSEETLELLDWLVGEQAQELIAAVGYVGL